MAKPNFYLKKLGHRGKIKIWSVDGGTVRKDIDEEFTNFGQHFRFKFIPEYEFWIDKEAVPDERKFFIEHLLIEWQLMKKGLSYESAIDIADSRERSERIKSGDHEKITGKGGLPDVSKVHLKLLNKTNGGLSVWLIDGRLVRSNFYVEFTSGGHNLVYPFIPKDEVWIDNDLSKEEQPFTLLHELYERQWMSKGLTYPQAHKRASRLEWYTRLSPAKLASNLAKLGIKS